MRCRLEILLIHCKNIRYQTHKSFSYPNKKEKSPLISNVRQVLLNPMPRIFASLFAQQRHPTELIFWISARTEKKKNLLFDGAYFEGSQLDSKRPKHTPHAHFGPHSLCYKNILCYHNGRGMCLECVWTWRAKQYALLLSLLSFSFAFLQMCVKCAQRGQ